MSEDYPGILLQNRNSQGRRRALSERPDTFAETNSATALFAWERDGLYISFDVSSPTVGNQSCQREGRFAEGVPTINSSDEQICLIRLFPAVRRWSVFEQTSVYSSESAVA